MTCRGQDFWVFDVSESILLAEMADVARRAAGAERGGWLAELENQLRVAAILGAEHGVDLDEWSGGHEEEFIALIREAAGQLADRRSISRDEAARWLVLEEHPIIWRNQDSIETAPIVAFASELIEIIHGTYPRPPEGTWWFLGSPGETKTIRMGTQGPPASDR